MLAEHLVVIRPTRKNNILLVVQPVSGLAGEMTALSRRRRGALGKSTIDRPLPVRYTIRIAMDARQSSIHA